MIRATVLYPSSATRFDYDYYINKHTTMVKDLWTSHGLVSVEISKGIAGLIPGSKPAFVTITNLVFTSVEALQGALAASGAQVMGDIPNFTDVQPEVQLNEILS